MFASVCSFTENDPLCMAYHPSHFVGELLLHPVYFESRNETTKSWRHLTLERGAYNALACAITLFSKWKFRDILWDRYKLTNGWNFLFISLSVAFSYCWSIYEGIKKLRSTAKHFFIICGEYEIHKHAFLNLGCALLSVIFILRPDGITSRAKTKRKCVVLPAFIQTFVSLNTLWIQNSYNPPSLS